MIEGKNGVIQDFRESLGNSYQWRVLPVPEADSPPPKPAFTVGQKVYTITEVNLRQTPGAADKPQGDVRVKIVPETECAIFGGPRLSTTWSGGRCAALLPASSTRAGPRRLHLPVPNSSRLRSRPNPNPTGTQTRS